MSVGPLGVNFYLRQIRTWHWVYDMLQVTFDMWHVTCDTWHIPCVVGILIFFLFNFYAFLKTIIRNVIYKALHQKLRNSQGKKLTFKKQMPIQIVENVASFHAVVFKLHNVLLCVFFIENIESYDSLLLHCAPPPSCHPTAWNLYHYFVLKYYTGLQVSKYCPWPQVIIY